jgi:hypothetical protein
MGLFSYDCQGCGHPLLAPCATDEGINTWMSQGVAVFCDGDRASGEYNGYGRLGWADGIERTAVWHRACFTVAGEPAYEKPSLSSEDQGHFFDDGAHDLLEPGVDHPEGALEAAQERRRLRRQDCAEKRAIKESFELAGWAAWEIEDEVRRKDRQDRLKQLKNDFSTFVEGQPDSDTILTLIHGEAWYDDNRGDLFAMWFDAMKALAQVAWLAERDFEVKHFVPGKSEAAWR